MPSRVASRRAALVKQIEESRKSLERMEEEVMRLGGWMYSHKMLGRSMYKMVLDPKPVFAGRHKALFLSMYGDENSGR